MRACFLALCAVVRAQHCILRTSRARFRVFYFGTGEEEEDGYSDEYTLEDLEVGTSDYVKQEGVADFRSAWEEMDESTELADSYGLGHRDSMQEAVEAVIAILGMQVNTLSGQTVTPCMTCTLLVLQRVVCHRSCICLVQYLASEAHLEHCTPTTCCALCGACATHSSASSIFVQMRG